MIKGQKFVFLQIYMYGFGSYPSAFVQAQLSEQNLKKKAVDKDANDTGAK